ncbi:MAG: KTSC domain-containing protein [Pseudomonadota bacterium]
MRLSLQCMPSTVIRTFSYDVNSRRLIVEFLSGRRYAYFNVPPDVYADMRSARSRGSCFNQKVRDQFSFSRLEA